MVALGQLASVGCLLKTQLPETWEFKLFNKYPLMSLMPSKAGCGCPTSDWHCARDLMGAWQVRQGQQGPWCSQGSLQSGERQKML